MLRPLLLFLCLWFCPAAVWAQEEYCGRGPVTSHACPMHGGQLCQCHEHELCYRIALEAPGPKAPAPPRFDFVCPPRVEFLFVVASLTDSVTTSLLPARPVCPSLAPEPPPPRA